MKKISNGIYEHNQNGMKLKCIKGSNENYEIQVWDNNFNRYVECGTGVSLASVKRRINDYIQM